MGRFPNLAGGESLLAPAVTRRLIERFLHKPAADANPARDPRLYRLSRREREVLRLVARGVSDAETVQELVVSPTTVKTHMASLLHKLGVRDRGQVVVIAWETGLDDR